MDSKTNYHVFQLPPSPTQAQVHGYATLRLLALQTNSECFGSTYQRESSFTDAEWRERLDDSADKATLVASALPQKDSASEVGAPEGDWVGTVTILGPDFLRVRGLSIPDIISKRGTVFHLVGMWVHPDHRSRGLGMRLIEASYDWIRRKDALGHVINGDYDKILSLWVHRTNKGAIAFYEREGFKQISLRDAEASEEELDRIWMVTAVA